MENHAARGRPRSKTSPFTATSWSPEGTASFVASGHDTRSALEAGLRAVLFLAGVALDSAPGARSAPLRGEGDDLAALFADLTEDLLAQLAQFGAGIADVTVDGVLRRDDGGLVAWGYASGTLEPEPAALVLALAGSPRIVPNEENRIVIDATLRRP